MVDGRNSGIGHIELSVAWADAQRSRDTLFRWWLRHVRRGMRRSISRALQSTSIALVQSPLMARGRQAKI